MGVVVDDASSARDTVGFERREAADTPTTERKFLRLDDKEYSGLLANSCCCEVDCLGVWRENELVPVNSTEHPITTLIHIFAVFIFTSVGASALPSVVSEKRALCSEGPCSLFDE